MLGKIHRAVQRGLAAHGRQNRIRAFLSDNAFHHLAGNRLNICHIGCLGVRHNRRGVAVDENDLIAFLAKSLTGLRAGIVEFAGLADDNRTRSDNKNGFNISALRHFLFT